MDLDVFVTIVIAITALSIMGLFFIGMAVYIVKGLLAHRKAKKENKPKKGHLRIIK